MKRYIFVFCLFLVSSAYSQNVINNYKYVIVPEKFSFLKENDQYSLNSNTKALLEKKGFTVFFDNALPSDVANNKCRALNAELLNKSTMFSTTLTLVLKDCQGNVVFKSKAGKSWEKDYSAGYNEAVKDAFTSLDQISYAYNGSTNEPVQQAGTATTTTVAVTSIVPDKSPVISTTPSKATEAIAGQRTGTLYAQAIPNGYQLIDTTPKRVLTLLKTSVDNYFIASNDAINGIVLKINEQWVFEYYSGGKLISEKLMVKF